MQKITCVALTVPVLFVLTVGVRSDELAKREKAPAKTRTVKARDLTLKVPEDWKQKQPGSSMRVAELEVPPAGEDKEPGEFVVFWFGERGAGGAQENIKRWVGQFEEEGRKMKIVSGEAASGKYTLVDLTGAYKKPVGPPIAGKSKRMADWRVLNVYIETDAGPYYLKLDGPQKTVAAVENDFRATFGGKKDSEKEQKPE
jgi:gluconolactonase